MGGRDEGDACSLKNGGGGDGLASMRTAATAVRTTGASDGAACSLKGGGGGGDGLASMRTAATAVRTTGAGDGANPPSPTTTLAPELGRYWLPWHIDSQFITLLTSDDFYDEVRVRVRVRVSVSVSVRVEVRVEGKG